MDNKVHPAPEDEPRGDSDAVTPPDHPPQEWTDPSQQPGQPGPSVGEGEGGSGAPGYDSAPPPPSNLQPPQQWASPPKQPGYPGPNVGGGYPNQQFPAQGYPNQGYPNQGFPNQGAPNQGHPNQGNPYGGGGYPNQQAASFQNNGDGVVTMQPGIAIDVPYPQVRDPMQCGDFFHMILAIFTTIFCGSLVCGGLAICTSGYSMYVRDTDRASARKWGSCSYVLSIIGIVTTLILLTVLIYLIVRI